MSHEHRPDPGRETAVAFLVERFGDARHQKPRTCLGCGGAGQSVMGQYGCYSGGPSVGEWCTDCYTERGSGTVWEYSLTWDAFWRRLPSPVEGQIAMELA